MNLWWQWRGLYVNLCVVSLRIDRSSCNVARFPITSLTFCWIHLLHRLLEPHVLSWCFLFVIASNYFMRGVTDFGADSSSCDPASCLVFLPFSSPAQNYLLLLLALQKFFSSDIRVTFPKKGLCDTWISFTRLFRVLRVRTGFYGDRML